MIASKQRVPRKYISLILKKGQQRENHILIIKYLENNEGINRTRTIVSKKMGKKAVTRNLLRRRLQSAIINQSKDISKGYDIIVIPKKELISSDYSTIKTELSNLWIN